jgi:hypothetical protein
MPPKKQATKVEEAAPAPEVEDKKVKKSASTKAETKTASKKAESKKSEAKSASKKADSKKSESKKTESKKAEKKPAAPAEKRERVKRDLTKELVHGDFLTLEQNFKETLRSLPTESRRAMGDIFRRFVDLRKDTTKVLRIKGKRQNSGEGGFKKGVKISNELSKFCSSNSANVLKWIEKAIAEGKSSGKASKWENKDYSGFNDWSVTKEHGRDKVTNFLCAYISDKNLQNPNMRKELKLDSALQTLFNLKQADKDNEGNAITYCTLQTLLTQHYPEALAAKKAKEAAKAKEAPKK